MRAASIHIVGLRACVRQAALFIPRRSHAVLVFTRSFLHARLPGTSYLEIVWGYVSIGKHLRVTTTALTGCVASLRAKNACTGRQARHCTRLSHDSHLEKPPPPLSVFVVLVWQGLPRARRKADHAALTMPRFIFYIALKLRGATTALRMRLLHEEQTSGA